ncbi:HK97-fold major capsid protein [Streptomyces sp. CoH17]|uniref:HK97-fold major capsid protein n=1 Tax=Streptomyces sp. CoH17 TaxID=2992806 RepID=UPI0022706310|nr:HK97-fold major capsid protein [Streptomyces sp. CoH17]
MSTPVAVGNDFQRFAKASDEYVNEIVAAQQKLGNRKLSKVEKQQKLAWMLKGGRTAGLQRLGQSMIGPIQLKLRYQGIVRNVLLEDPLTPGVPIMYDVLDDLGQGYMLHGNEGEVKITPFEGKRVQVNLFRLASFPQIKKEDLYNLRVNVVEYAQDETKQALMKQEDGRLITLLEAAISQYAAIDPLVKSGEPHAHTITVTGGYLTPNVFYDAVSSTDEHELDAGRLLMNPRDYRDLYRWDINTTGWAFKDRTVAGERIVQFGEFQIGKSIIIPSKTTYLTPEPEFLGVFPVMYSLDVEENNQVEQFHYGWVMDELIGMAILNPRGVVKLVKA